MGSFPVTKIRVGQLAAYKWRLQLAPKTFYESETAPCLFHRVMLKLVLGFTWRRINTTKDTNNDRQDGQVRGDVLQGLRRDQTRLSALLVLPRHAAVAAGVAVDAAVKETR